MPFPQAGGGPEQTVVWQASSQKMKSGGSQSSPASTVPFPQLGGGTLVVEVLVVGVDVDDVVVEEERQPVASHPVGTLCAELTQAVRLWVLTHFAGSKTTRCRSRPSGRTRQQTAAPGHPQTDSFACFSASRRQLRDNCAASTRAFTTSVPQRR